MGNTLISESTTTEYKVYELLLQLQWNIKLSVNRRPAMGNIPIVINDYKNNQYFV